jgi:hypothetical protein
LLVYALAVGIWLVGKKHCIGSVRARSRHEAA